MEASILSIALKLVGAIALLMYGMKVMSEALQKISGPGLRHILSAMTTNPFTGILTGMTVTVAVQSSAATTVMTVSFVNAGLLSLAQAISIIMGANIGTTLSAWIMSAGFSFNIINVVWPVFLVAIILIQTGKYRYIGDFLFGLSFLFFALGTLSMTGREMDLGNNPAVVDFFARFDPGSYGTILLFLLIGAILTAMAQSSAALMAITMVLCTTGVLNIYQGIALVMGENIGTTLTANLAAMSGNVQARRAALAHLLFNMFGVCWMLCVFHPFVRLACGIVGIDPDAGTSNPATLSFALAAFHTLFNIINTSVLVWFIPQIEKVVCSFIKPKEGEEENEFKLQFITGGIMKTPEIAVLQAQKEILSFSEGVHRMFGAVKNLYEEPENFDELYERISKAEEKSDNMENEIGKYLSKVGEAHLSDSTKGKIRSMIREVGELESIADSCFNISRILRRKHNASIKFESDQDEGTRKMFDLVDDALLSMHTILEGDTSNPNKRRAFTIEDEIDSLRDLLLEKNLIALDSSTHSYECGTIYKDLLSESEKLSDYVINVVEAKIETAD